MIDRRLLLQALAAIAGAGGAQAAFAQAAPAEDAGAEEIGWAYLAARPTPPSVLQADLFPHGMNAAAVKALSIRAKDDFRIGRLFIHEGWRLSDTEGRIFALLASTPAFVL